LALALIERGHSVTVIDRDPAAFERLGPRFAGRTVAGVGFDREVLLEAGIERADGLAAVTASDEANVVAARAARQVFRVPRVVARLHEPAKAEIYRRLGLQTVTPITWGIQRIAELLCHSQLDTVLSLGNGEVEIVEVEVPPLLHGRRASELTVPAEITVIALQRDGRTTLPALGTVLSKGDLVHLAVLASSVDRLKTLLAIE
jgi:trk system potassium uptake protein TrkA